MKNAFKNQLEMNENSWKINGLLYCGSHDENVFVFFWCVRFGRDGLVSNPLDFHGNQKVIGISGMHAKSMEINENKIEFNENQRKFVEN